MPVIFPSLTPFFYINEVHLATLSDFGKYNGNVDLILGEIGVLDSCVAV